MDEVGLQCSDTTLVTVLGAGGAVPPRIASVPLLAARWSVDPASISARMPADTRGTAGELSRSRTR